MVTSGFVVGASDVCIQLSTHDHEYDLRRTLLVGGGYGFFWFAPVIHLVTTTWARVLPSTSFGALTFKTIFDMTTSFPINVSVMLGMNALARQPEVNPLDSIYDNFWPSYTKGWMVWPFVGFTMYRYIPLSYRVLYVNTVSFFWNGYLCFRFKNVDQMENVDLKVKVTGMNHSQVVLPFLPGQIPPEKMKALVERTTKKMNEHYTDWSVKIVEKK